MLSHVQLFATDCSPLGSSVHEIFQARILKWVSRFLLQGLFLTQGSNSVKPPNSYVSCISKWILYH